MLQKLMDLNVYFYTITGVGILGLLLMYVMNTVSKKKLCDKSSYTKVVHRLNGVTLGTSIISMAAGVMAVVVSFFMGQVRDLGLRHLGLALAVTFVVICYGKYLAFSDRDHIWSNYMFQLVGGQASMEVPVGKTAERSAEKNMERTVVEQMAVASAKKNAKKPAKILPKAAVKEVQKPEPVKEPTKDQMVEKALQGIRESAATRENRFSHLLSKEEEDIVREVIREYLT